MCWFSLAEMTNREPFLAVVELKGALIICDYKSSIRKHAHYCVLRDVVQIAE